MKRFIRSTLIIALLAFSSSAHGADEIDQYAEDTENVWRTGAGAHDGAFTAISSSMIGWGIGLALGIAILAAVLHQSTASSGGGGSGHCH